MANTTLPVTDITRAGIIAIGAGEVTCVPANHHVFTNDGKIFVTARNTDSGSHNVSLQIQTLVDGQTVSPRVVVVGAGVCKVIGPFPRDKYNVPSGGDKNKIYIDGDDVTLKFQAFRVSPV